MFIPKHPHKELEERNLEIFRLRVKEGWTLQKIGTKFGLTRERVRQILEELKAQL